MGMLNVIALISGGKDSFFSILHCLANGHRVVALANLHPLPPGDGGRDGESQLADDDLNSFMYQTVGHTVIPLYEEALGIPLYRQPIQGIAADVEKSYHPPGDNAHGTSPRPSDETESLVPLLQRILRDHPTANAVSTGAILSDYQRTRVESVAVRLGLVPLSYLWQYPHLCNGLETSLLDDMGAVGQDARIIKVASGGLDASFLWENVAEQRTKRRLMKAMGRFGGLGGGTVLGEGGEYETLVVDGPTPLWKKRIDIGSEDHIIVQGGGGSAYLKITGARLVTKDCPEDETIDAETVEGLRIPDLLDARFDGAVRSADVEGGIDASLSSTGPMEVACGGNIVAKETWAVRKGETTLFISNMVAGKGQQGSMETEITDIVRRLRALLESENKTPDDIVYTTILLRSMASFPEVNKIYSALFARPNPPARATVACGECLGGNIHVLLSVVVDLRPRRFRKGLHVQSRSYWAPANIGPYSQAIASPLEIGEYNEGESAGDSLVYVAGQIPLEPASMELHKLAKHKVEDLYSFRFHAALALQHLWRVGECMDTKWWVGGIAFIARSPGIQRRAWIAWRIWEERNLAHRGSRGNDSEGQEEAVLDVWDQKYGRANKMFSNEQAKTPLPNFELIDITGPLAPTSPFFAVEVDELPRGSYIEWSGLGVSGPDRIHISEGIDIGSNLTDDISMSYHCLLSDKRTEFIYGTIKDGLSSDRFQSAFERLLLSGGKPGFRKAGTESFVRILQITVYTAKDPDEALNNSSGLNAEYMAPHTPDPANSRSDIHSDLPQGPALRQLSRSPHPYRRRKVEPRWLGQPDSGGNHIDVAILTPSPYPSDQGSEDEATRGHHDQALRRDYRSLSDSGTEADDESYTFLKGLPAPPVRLRKGLRDAGEEGVERSLTPPHLGAGGSKELTEYREGSGAGQLGWASAEAKKEAEKTQRVRRSELIRRVVEFGLVACIGVLLLCGENFRRALRNWHRAELLCHFAVVLSVLLLYPLCILLSQASFSPPSIPKFRKCFQAPPAFDPAPILYPILLPVYVALALLPDDQRFLTPNLILSLASLPHQLFPNFQGKDGYNTLHWFITMIPFIASEVTALLPTRYPLVPHSPRILSPCGLDREVLVCLYPLHQALLPVLRYLTTTSLLAAELQLLSVSLVNLLIHALSPQAVILESLLWGGGIAIFVLCAHVLKWGVALARVPKWKFRRAGQAVGARDNFLDLLARVRLGRRQNAENHSDHDREQLRFGGGRHDLRLWTHNANGSVTGPNEEKEPRSAIEGKRVLDFPGPGCLETGQPYQHQRRHTLSSFSPPLPLPKRPRSMLNDRRKRRTYSTIHSLLSLTYAQAQTRKWLYAGYVYLVVVVTILAGIRSYVGKIALNGNEPIGWSIGYLFGNIQRLRLFVVEWNLERWICLPSWATSGNDPPLSRLGRTAYGRRKAIGEANTRLVISGYWVGVIAIGMIAVLRLQSVVEVDTRRKVFHGMMVAMLLPATYIDPAFTSLALGLVLAIFLLLDLIRASQLPPLSKPLAHFLTPYVDGRDLRGPVVVSHIFLLVGCAIPLWLSLAGIKRTGTGCWKGWDVERREVGMVSGVVCVGMGDAAASLVGRRFGRSRWVWSGGKSIEGSVAFAVAVVVGLAFARVWLVVGGWGVSIGGDGWVVVVGKMSAAACGASWTEAVLTGGNDNVVVPVVLWLFVKGLGI
ncbi:MAG: hypothetical protein M1839_002938 [Geoglossum umbratile]|nr:MAG: hypothetical protein M1839_002938 [Geoglossum umbratile]